MAFLPKIPTVLVVAMVLFALYFLMSDDRTPCEGLPSPAKDMLRSKEYGKGEIGKLEFGYKNQDAVRFCAIPLQNRYNIQCERLINGDASYMQTLSSLDVRFNDSCNLTSMLSDCRRFRINHGYDGKPMSQEEVEFPIAFGIKIHKDPMQVEQLLRAIYRPQNAYCIHVDLKSDRSVSHPLLELAKCFDNVFVIQKYRVIYSSIRQPLADIACMKEIRHRKWKYYIILAGQEFVLKTNLEIVKILKILNGTNDIDAIKFPRRLKTRYTMRHAVNDDTGTIEFYSNITKTPFQHNITFFKGSSYGMFSRAFVQFILDSSLPEELFAWAHDVYAPEELLWATLNSLPDAPGGFKSRSVRKSESFFSRAVIWHWDRALCHGEFFRAVCTFSIRDLPWLVSSPQVVANKFHSDYDQLAIDCLEEWIRNKTALGTTANMNWFYYRNAAHVVANNVHLPQYERPRFNFRKYFGFDT